MCRPTPPGCAPPGRDGANWPARLGLRTPLVEPGGEKGRSGSRGRTRLSPPAWAVPGPALPRTGHAPAGFVRVQADRGPDASFSAATRSAAADCSASVPTSISRVTPAALACVDGVGADPFIRDVAMAVAPHRCGLGVEAREKRGASCHRQPARVPSPLRCVREASHRPANPPARYAARSPTVRASGPGWPVRPLSAGPRGHRPTPRRRRARALPAKVRPPPERRWRPGPAARWPRGRRWGRSGPRPGRRPRKPLPPVSARGLSGRGAGPIPPHFCSTTALTRASRLPRLLARSAL